MSIQKLFDLTGQTAIVTGGGRGLGRQIALGLAEAGANIVLCSRNLAACESVKQEIIDKGREAIALYVDVTKPDTIDKLVDAAISQFGKITILVNNSGIGGRFPAAEMPLEKWQSVIDTNLTGVFLMCQAVGKTMIENSYGKIVNIGSAAGFKGTEPFWLDNVAYNSSKGALSILTKDLAVKWGPLGVYVNTVAPGTFPTDINREKIAKIGEIMLDNIPLRRFGGENDLMGAVLFFASGASNFCTGQTLPIDGGLTAK
ncbi:glucose 1-dehydrogenase [Neobacillus sp. FSL H8-0543]|uniref:glucose 1-dehydrogenase n=1 Tax=Neobacillus sp. FSL H8-0543 TaxID=2954672 RepID=UPI003158F849